MTLGGSTIPSRSHLIQELEALLRESSGYMNRRTRANLSSFGLSLPRLFVLLIVEKHGPISQRAVQDHLGLAPSTVSGFVDQLVCEELLQRERDATDRRTVLLSLTDKGAGLLAEILTFRREVLAAALDDLPTEDLLAVNKHLSRVVKGMHDDHKR